MEKTIRFNLQVQEAKVVTPEKEQVVKAPGWNNKPEAVREIWVRNPEADKLKCPLEHLDARWGKTVYWSEREKTYKHRDPNVPVPWIRTPDWKPETDKEAAERCKGWASGYHLEHKKAKAGGIHKIFEDLDRKVRIVRVYNNEPLRCTWLSSTAPEVRSFSRTSWRKPNSTPPVLVGTGVNVGERSSVGQGSNIGARIARGEEGGSVCFFYVVVSKQNF